MNVIASDSLYKERSNLPLDEEGDYHVAATRLLAMTDEREIHAGL